MTATFTSSTGGFSGQVALVTGAGAGIGRSTALLLHERGATVAIVDCDGEAARAVKAQAPFLLTQAFGRHVARRGSGGKIVNVLSSSLFRAALLSGVDYVVSKGGLLGLTRAAAGDLAALDVNVNAVAPGLTDTPGVLSTDASEEEHAATLQRLVSEGPLANAFHRVSRPEDVAETIVFLCSPASRQITGQVVHTSAGAVI